ncbi:neuropeptide SIFamide receptor-like [Pocillopora damicornis]|uniref:neuropeptide SIFamide receptor-like n=1 Tax=Pocillopora damicornis TaxID=46731 RepID=UPI000F556686|nr:neuropeptide SIFamide receptor-like [Pocillopora damicornis]
MTVNTTVRHFFENSSQSTSHAASSHSDQACEITADSALEVTAKALAYIFIFLVSFFGNIFLLVVIYKKKQLRRSINYFVFNMAVSDLFNPLTIMTVKIVEIISGSSSWKVDRPWLLGNILCKLAYFLPDVSSVVSIGSLLLISIDRLIAVVFPLRAKLISSKVRLISILSTWFVAIAIHAPYFYSFKLIPHENETYCELNWGPAFDHMKTHRGFVTANFITFIPIPICVLASVYSIIVWTIRKKNKKTKEKLSCRQNHRDRQLRNIVRLAVAIMMSFVSCMTPLLIYLFLIIFLWNWESPPICAFQTVLPFICVFLLHSWSAVNPCICFIFSKNYRNGLRQCFHCNCLSRRISGLQEKYQMQTTTSSYGDSSLQTHSSSVHFVSYSRKA